LSSGGHRSAAPIAPRTTNLSARRALRRVRWLRVTVRAIALDAAGDRRQAASPAVRR
jgi:hypothetical protein